MSRVFRHLFEKLKETNADECSQACRSRPRHHPGLGTATAPGDKRSVAALGWRRPLTASCRECLPSVVRARRVLRGTRKDDNQTKRTDISCLIDSSELL
jgi:hypothetical protein